MPQSPIALVLEDDRYMRVLLSELLRQQDMRAATASHPSEAEVMCAFQRFDVAVVDVGLGDGDGIDFIRKLRRDRTTTNRFVPILIVSGQSGRAVIERARDSGADAYLVKPVSAALLAQKIEAVKNRRRAFIDEASYCGPDRRRAEARPYEGPDRRRRADDSHYL